MENNKEIPDLDRLKAAWSQDLQRQSESAEFINRQNLSNMMHQRTHSLISRLKRNLMIEVLTTALIMIALFAFVQWRQIPVPPLAWAFFVLVTFSGHLLLYRSLRRQDTLCENDLSKALDTSIQHTGRFVRTFNQSAIVLALVIFLGGLKLSLAVYEQGPNAWLGVLYAFLAATGEYFLTRAYVQKLYGQYHEKLLACRAELTRE